MLGPKFEPERCAEADLEGEVEQHCAEEEREREDQDQRPPDHVARVVALVRRAFWRQAVDVVQEELQHQTLKSGYAKLQSEI